MANPDEPDPVGLFQECFMTFRNVLKPGRNEIVAGYILGASKGQIPFFEVSKFVSS